VPPYPIIAEQTGYINGRFIIENRRSFVNLFTNRLLDRFSGLGYSQLIRKIIMNGGMVVEKTVL
jgi:hypothetical protein